VSLIPSVYVHRLYEISVPKIKEKGIRLLFLDYDNLLVKHGSDDMDERTAAWLNEVRGAGILTVILSNNVKGRSSDFAKRHGIPVYAFSIKPLPHNYYRAMKAYGCGKKECLAVGDTVVTDVFGAHAAGICSVLCDPLSGKDNFFGSVFRLGEKMVLALWKKKGVFERGAYYGKEDLQV